jgi:predicted branched-subunit amino acid permease
MKERAAFAIGGGVIAILGVVVGFTYGPGTTTPLCEMLLTLGLLAIFMPAYAGSTRDRVVLLSAATILTFALLRISVIYFICGPLLTLLFIQYRNRANQRGKASA